MARPRSGIGPESVLLLLRGVEVREMAEGRGFARLTREARTELARKGAKRAGEFGRAHRWTREEAREAGKKGAATRKARARARDLVGGRS
jgi:general stress protein YciG